jgi:hypothetical protein
MFSPTDLSLPKATLGLVHISGTNFPKFDKSGFQKFAICGSNSK